MSIQAELYRILKSWKSRVFILVIFLVPIWELLILIKQIIIPQWPIEWSERIRVLNHPAMASFLSGASHGHTAQMLLIWLMPIYVLLIYGDSYIQEKSCGYTGIIYSQYSRKKIIRTKFATSFLVFFGVFFMSMLLNFILANLIFMGGGRLRGFEQSLAAGVLSPFEVWSVQNPVAAYLISMVIYCVLAGCTGVMCCAVCYLFPSYKLAYPICFFIWFIQITMEPSIIYALQPFTGNTVIKVIFPLLRFFVIGLIVVLISWWREVRCDKY